MKRRIEKIISGSPVPEDPVHSKNTLEWLLKLEPEADIALQTAALGHDIERAIENRKIRREPFINYDEFKAAHAKNSAEILMKIMEDCSIKKQLADEIIRLVLRHETGGDQRSELLKNADSISFFDVNLPYYFKRNGWDETKQRCEWGYKRLSAEMKIIVMDITHEKNELNKIMKTIFALDQTHDALNQI